MLIHVLLGGCGLGVVLSTVSIIKNVKSVFTVKAPTKTITVSLSKDEFILGRSLNTIYKLSNTLVVGSTGSGKSTCLNDLVKQFLDQRVRVSIIDFKKVEFVEHITKLTRLITNEEDCLEYLQEVKDMVDKRLEYMMAHRIKTYDNYPHVILIDEFQTLIENKKCKALIYDIICKCRATNIFLILSCQAPRSDVVEGKIRDNIINTIIFRCETDVMSEVATGEKGNYIGTILKGEGHGLLKYKGKYYEFE